MSMDSLADLLEDELKDLYSAEKQILKALPKMAKKATTPQLKAAFESHLKETEGHAKRLETIGEKLDIKLTGKVCKATKGLVEEGSDVLDEDGDSSVIDTALIGSGRRVEHYEIAAYAATKAIAEALGHTQVAKLLQQTLDEEGAAEKKLTKIAETGVLEAAASAGE